MYKFFHAEEKSIKTETNLTGNTLSFLVHLFPGFFEHLVRSMSDFDLYYICETLHKPEYKMEKSGLPENGWRCKTGERQQTREIIQNYNGNFAYFLK